jgi:FhuF 2Fe-2S C-terminal domain
VTVTVTAPPSPLGPSIAALDAAVSWCSFRLGIPPDEATGDAAVGWAEARVRDGWVRCSDALDDPDFFPRWRAALGARLGREHGCARVPEQTAAGYVMGWYAGLFGYLGGTLFHLCRRVPSLAPENLAFRLHPRLCRPAEVALLGGAFACLPSDPAGAHPDAGVVTDVTALAGRLRAEVAAHGERFVPAFRRGSQLGRRMVWAAVTDALDRGVWHAGRDAAGAADAALVLPSRLAPFTSGSTIHQVHSQGHTLWTRHRQSCCFHYKLPGADPCSTCPRLLGRPPR